jgi:uncharacterized phiE125 gp8 family phage protein
MRLSLITPPEPAQFNLTEVKAYLRVDGNDEDGVLLTLMEAAADLFTGETGRQVLEATYELILPAFPARGASLVLPRPPLQSVTSVTYIDSAGGEVVWGEAEYTVTAPQGPYAGQGFIAPASGLSYPSTARRDDAVRVEYVAGWDVDDLPDAIKLRLLLVAADFYANRETQVVGQASAPSLSARALLAPFRLPVYA